MKRSMQSLLYRYMYPSPSDFGSTGSCGCLFLTKFPISKAREDGYKIMQHSFLSPFPFHLTRHIAAITIQAEEGGCAARDSERKIENTDFPCYPCLTYQYRDSERGYPSPFEPAAFCYSFLFYFLSVYPRPVPGFSGS